MTYYAFFKSPGHRYFKHTILSLELFFFRAHQFLLINEKNGKLKHQITVESCRAH